MLPCRKGCILVPAHREWQVRIRRWRLPRLVCCSESICTGPSSPPPVSRLFLALPRRRTRGHEIDRFSILFGRYFSRFTRVLTFSASRSSRGRIVGYTSENKRVNRLFSFTITAARCPLHAGSRSFRKVRG